MTSTDAAASAEEVCARSTRWLDDEEQRAWMAVAAILTQLPGALDAQLQRDSGLTSFEYFVLSGLSMAEGRHMRMGELASFANGSMSRLSNVVKRLEERGWVARCPDEADRRATVARLTDAGYDVVVQAAPGHVGAVRHYVLDPLSPTQVKALAGIGQKIR